MWWRDGGGPSPLLGILPTYLRLLPETPSSARPAQASELPLTELCLRPLKVPVSPGTWLSCEAVFTRV